MIRLVQSCPRSIGCRELKRKRGKEGWKGISEESADWPVVG